MAAVEVQQFLHVDVDRGGVLELLDFLEGEEVNVVGGVDGLRCAEDVMCDGDSAAEDGLVFDVVDSAARAISDRATSEDEASGRISYNSDAVCSIVTTLEIIVKLSGGT